MRNQSQKETKKIEEKLINCGTTGNHDDPVETRSNSTETQG